MGLCILKLGGSLITFKEKPFTIRYDVLKRISKEISKYISEGGSLILVHGGGSFGHYVAKEFMRRKGYYDSEAFAKISEVMMELNLQVIKELIRNNIHVIPIQTHSISYIENEKIHIDTKIIKESLKRGLLPVLYGDIVLSISDDSKYEILSGDTLAWILANKLNASKLLFATNVNGVFDKDPKESDAKLLREVSLSSLHISISKPLVDVTGGMMRKLVEGIKYIRNGLEVLIFNGLVENNVYNALKGIPIICTYVRP